jgi:hypothetical protein
MANISTPGLIVSPRAKIRRSRVLPIKGDVLVEQGQIVQARDIVAKSELPGYLHPLNAAAMLGVSASELKGSMTAKEGDRVSVGQVLGETKSFFGVFKNTILSPVEGTLESVSALTGQVMLREAPKPIELRAYAPGEVVQVIESTGVVIQSEVVLVQGIFGLGGETFGKLMIAGDGSFEPVTADHIAPEHRDAVLLVRGSIELGAMQRMIDIGVRGAVAASADGFDLMKIAGREINAAATGDEQIGFTLVLTEGFGDLTMAPGAYDLLCGLEGADVSINGTTQIRAGVIRPEIMAPLRDRAENASFTTYSEPGKVRVIRGIKFGAQGRIKSAPEQPRRIGSGAEVLVFEVDLDDGTDIAVPRSNVETMHE